ncbi:SMI1/KNR4 family protein [Streptomyces sp. WM4235]|uniref:SMI1/KNR4 family protein n=1 Tax=Streptomyces sp. WM4235 TaxID=1415551 RepID=UPI0006B04202|nr:SMI1/KNR4 family protein [Streptomyces sp. WM4235]
MPDYPNAVAALLGTPRDLFAGHAAWQPLEAALGVSLPDDYKHLVDAYAPVQINGHLYLDHPANEFSPLGAWILDTIEDFENQDGSDGLIPAACTDRSEYVFLAPGSGKNPWRVVSCGRDEPDFYEHQMTFSEWIYRYLAGEDMFEPGDAVFYPGPVRLEGMPTSANDGIVKWYGPDR